MNATLCNRPGCAAAHVVNETCVLHGGPDRWAAFLERIRTGAKLDELCGCTIGAVELTQILDSLPKNEGVRRINAADFTDSTFETDVSFEDSAFSGETRFTRAVFKGELSLKNVTIEDVELAGVKVDGKVVCDNVEVTGDLRSGDTVQLGELSASKLTCSGSVIPVLVSAGPVQIQDGVFTKRVTTEIDSPRTVMSDLEFTAGTSLTLARGTVNLDLVRFGQSSVVAGRSVDVAVRLESLLDVDVSDLTLRNVDVSSCHFGAAHGVDELTMDNLRWGRPRWWLSDRAVVAEERDAEHDPASVGRIYRRLRKSLESSKDDAGASDFYYGEMLMRRRSRLHDVCVGGIAARVGALIDYLLLSLYWAISGFGLRIGRSIIAFIVLVGGCALLLANFGYVDAKPTFTPVATGQDGSLVYQLVPLTGNEWNDNIGRAIRLAAQSSVSLLQTTTLQLTPAGEWIVLVLRFAGPIVIGLAILAVRNKLRR